ncbi:histidine phosphatase superfamily [Hysterangium stoloniferum]|nr:histidine phosphatase superfamily [Hysterangium stoloniferum]
MIEKIYIARHGFRLNWVTNIWKSPTGTARDPPISAYGEKQAQELAEHIASLPLDDRPTAIFSSPFYRCLQTALPVATALDIPIYIENGVSEWFSPIIPGSGLHPIPPPAPTLANSFPFLRIDPASWSPTYIPSRKGETLIELHDRCRDFLEAFIPRVESLSGGKHKNILIVSHAATVIALVRALAGKPEMVMRVACCSLTTLERPREREGKNVGVWKVGKLTDGVFLTNGLERDWGFEDVVFCGQEVIQDPGEHGSEDEVQESVGLQDFLSPQSKM